MVGSRPVGVWALHAGTLFLALTALVGGFNPLRDPTGGGVDVVIPLDPSHLAGTPFPDYTVPGLLLVVFLGLYPLVVLYGQVTRTSWARPASVLEGVVLLVWLVVEVSLIGYVSPLQPAYGALGVVLIALCYVPSVRAYLEGR